MTAALLWSGIGTHWKIAWMDSFQATVIEQPIAFLLTPTQWIFAVIQQSLQDNIRGRGVADSNTRLSNQDLLERQRALENENAFMHERLREVEAQLAAFNQLKTANISPNNVLQATVTGYNATPGTSILTLDKGSTSGVTEGAPVLFAPPTEGTPQGVTLLGRVQRVFQLSCEVRLLSDPASRVQTYIVRPSLRPAGTAPNTIADIRITNEPHLVHGLGSNEMAMDDLGVQNNNVPRIGDLIQLIDNSYSLSAQNMVIGQIDNVTTRESQKLRYSIHITPRVAITSLNTVMILVK